MIIIRTLLIFSILLLVSCSPAKKLNCQINSSQKKSLKDSPFQSAKGMKKELKRQFQFRQLYIDDLLEIKNSFEGDTIILKETYDYICFGCPADYVEIFTDSLVFTYRLKDENYSRTEESISESYYTGNGLFQGDISEIMNDIKKEQEWNKYASKYGTEECLDGGHTIYTIFINNDKTESMYMRCWVNKAMRKEK